MQRPNFFYWYFNKAIHEILEIWKNFLLFTVQYFSIKELLLTLFSPWHRDVAIGNWRGLHPIKTLQLLFENLFSRLIGALVRLLVIFSGIFFLLLNLVLGILVIFFWISAPISIVAISIYFHLSLLIMAGSIFSWLLVSVFFFFSDTKNGLFEMQPNEFCKTKVFKRICNRLEVEHKEFSKIISDDGLLEEFLRSKNLTRQEFNNVVGWEKERQMQKDSASKFWRWENLAKIKPIGRYWRYGYTVNLDRYCFDLSKSDFTFYAKSELIGRNNEYELLKLILQRPDQNCALVVGNSGIGKKTLIHALARNIRLRDEKNFDKMRILLLDLGKFISDAINNGRDVEEELRMVFSESCYAGNVILAIEHIEHFLGKEQSTFHPDISVVLSEFLHIPSFKIIATSTAKEYHDLIEKEQQITKYFEVIEMSEPSEEETMKILLMQLESYESKRIIFAYDALKSIITESGKLKWEFPLPERAIDLAMDVMMYWEKNSDEDFISEKTVADYLTLKTGVQHGDVAGDERKKLLNLEEHLHRQVIGQEEAIKQLSEALRRARSGIGNSQKPIGSFLFLGPTGVGKTETAKALAKTYFGDEAKMVRFDMSEFQSPNSIDRLIGSSQLNKPGRLSTQIKDNPYSIVLLDEIEKAYSDILDIFLQILDEGFFTDALGEKINFRNTIIIATSNAGAVVIKDMVENGSDAEEIKKTVIDHAIERNIFKAEFLNRFDGVIFFKPLNQKELKSVVRLQLQKLIRRVAKEKNIEIIFNDAVVERIINKGYNPLFGARSLNHYVQDEVESIIAKKIISGELQRGEKIDLSL